MTGFANQLISHLLAKEVGSHRTQYLRFAEHVFLNNILMVLLITAVVIITSKVKDINMTALSGQL